MGVKVSGDLDTRDMLKRVDKALLAEFNNVGLKCVRYARNRTAQESWIDQTGNLRSSIGYIVTKDGEVVSKSSFDKVLGPNADKANLDGSQEGESYALSLASEHADGYALVVVAGMDYASNVEALDNKDVLASAEVEGGRWIKERLDRIFKK